MKMKKIMENFRDYCGETILEAMEHNGFYMTTRHLFLKTIEDMVNYTVKLGDVEAAKQKVMELVDSGKYSNHELRSLVASGRVAIVRGLYATTKEKFAEALDDAGQLALQGKETYPIQLEIERNVDRGKYSDPRTRNLEERDWQKESDKIKDHPEAKTRVLDTGANKETGGGKGHQKRDKKRGKSAPPGAGGV